MVVESHMSCKEHSGFPKVTTVKVMDGLGEHILITSIPTKSRPKPRLGGTEWVVQSGWYRVGGTVCVVQRG